MKLFQKSSSYIIILALPFFIGAMLFLWAEKAKAACSDATCEEHGGFHVCAWKGSCGGCSDLPPEGVEGWQLLTPSVPNGESNPCYLYGQEGEWCWSQFWTGTCGTCCGGGGGFVTFSGLVLSSDAPGLTWTPTSVGCKTGRNAPFSLDCPESASCSDPNWTCSVVNPTGGFFEGSARIGGFVRVALLNIPAPYNSCRWWVLDRNNNLTGEHGEGCIASFDPGTSDRDRALRFEMKTTCPCGSCFTICSCASVAAASPAKEFAKKTGEKAFIPLADKRKSVYDFSPERLMASFPLKMGKIFQKIFGFFNLLSLRK